MEKVHVVILDWNGSQDTFECIDSLLLQRNVILNLLLIDNGSREGSLDRVKIQYPCIEIIRNQRNLGYAGGMNTGIRAALDRGAHYILLLNNDTILKSDLIHKLLLPFTAKSSRVGLTAPTIFYNEDPDVVWSIGGNIQPLLLEMTSHQGGSIQLPNRPIERDFVSGCAMLIDATIFKEVELFDEKFYPAYYEDLDFCLRLRRSGYHIILVPQAHLLHKVSRSSGGRLSPKVFYLMARNSAYYFRKHMKLWQMPFIIVFRLLSAIKTSIRLFYKKEWICLIAYWQGLANGWLGLFNNSNNSYLSYYQ